MPDQIPSIAGPLAVAGRGTAGLLAVAGPCLAGGGCCAPAVAIGVIPMAIKTKAHVRFMRTIPMAMVSTAPVQITFKILGLVVARERRHQRAEREPTGSNGRLRLWTGYMRSRICGTNSPMPRDRSASSEPCEVGMSIL